MGCISIGVATVEEGTGEEVDTLQLGGNIELAGFKGLDGGSMIVVKKVVGNYARKFSEIVKGFERLKVTLKPVHKTEGSQINELHTHLLAAGKPITASEADRNLFFALDKVMKKVEAEIGKQG